MREEYPEPKFKVRLTDFSQVSQSVSQRAGLADISWHLLTQENHVMWGKTNHLSGLEHIS
jgi:hypothetical protein